MVDKGLIDPKATGTPRIGTEEGPMASGSTDSPKGTSTRLLGKTKKPTRAEQ